MKEGQRVRIPSEPEVVVVGGKGAENDATTVVLQLDWHQVLDSYAAASGHASWSSRIWFDKAILGNICQKAFVLQYLHPKLGHVAAVAPFLLYHLPSPSAHDPTLLIVMSDLDADRYGGA